MKIEPDQTEPILLPAFIAKAVDHRVGQRTKHTCQDGKKTRSST